MIRIIAALLVLTLSGCSSLILRNDDTAMEKTGKVAARVALAPLTLGMLELGIYERKLIEQCDREGGTYVSYNHSCSHGSTSYASTPVTIIPMPSFQFPSVQAAAPVQSYQLPMPQAQRQCYTSPIGNSFYTTCY